MPESLYGIVTTALIGFAGWVVKDLFFGLMKQRNELERREWEHRLKDVYCPLYFWSGQAAMHLSDDQRTTTLSELQTALAKAAYVLPKKHYFVVVQQVERLQGQQTSGVDQTQWYKTRAFLYDQIEVLNLLLYRTEVTGGIGDPGERFRNKRRSFRLVLSGVRHLVVWMFAASGIAGAYWLVSRGQVIWIVLIILGIASLVLFDALEQKELRTEIARRLSR